MIFFRIRELIKAKAAREGRKISLTVVADETGVNRSSLSKMARANYRHATSTANIDILCGYFGCEVSDLMVYRPDLESGPEEVCKEQLES